MQQTSLYIPKPCHEDWNKMTPTQQGKFCSACSKQVVDFSLMSDNQVLNILSNQPGKLCGRFDAEQLQRPLVETKIKKKKSWWMAAFMPLFFMNNKYHDEKNIMFNVDTSIQPKPINVTMGVIIPPVNQKNIHGKILDEKKDPLVYVTVMQKGTQNTTVTDSAGNFSIDIDFEDSVTLVASYVGYETVEKQIALSKADSIMVNIEMLSYTTTGLTEIVLGKMKTYSTVTPIDTVKAAIKKICGIEAFKIFPNPAIKGSSIHLKIKQAGEYQVQLFNNTSKLVATENINSIADKSISDFALPLNIASGIYCLRLINEQTKKSFTEKLVIQ